MKFTYKFPARSRAAIVEYLVDICGYSNNFAFPSYPLVFNVKAHYVDLGFDHS